MMYEMCVFIISFSTTYFYLLLINHSRISLLEWLSKQWFKIPIETTMFSSNNDNGIYFSLSHFTFNEMLFYFTFVYVLAKSLSTKLKICEERKICYLPQDLIQKLCFLSIQYDANFCVLVHEVIQTLEVLFS